MKWQEGLEITFRGCTWDAGWEFDRPGVIYEPVKRYFSHNDFEREVEDVCIDLGITGEVSDSFHEGDLQEFAWRGWSPTGFKKRKNAHQESITVRFAYDEKGERSFEFVEAGNEAPAL